MKFVPLQFQQAYLKCLTIHDITIFDAILAQFRRV